MRPIIFFAVLLLAGCVGASPEKPYTVRLIRPDGVVHKTVTITRSYYPPVHSNDSGISWVSNSGVHAPVGWLIEVEPQAEDAGSETRWRIR